MSFDLKDDRFWKYRARRTFLEAVKELCPSVLESLRDETFTVFRSFLHGAYRDDPTLDIRDFSRAELLRLSRKNQSLRDVVLTVDLWCQKWEIASEWFADAILQTLHRWFTFEPALDALEWHLQGFGYYEPTEYRQAFTFRFRAWNPVAGEGRDDYREAAREAFSKHLKSYLDEKSESLEENGWTKARNAPNEEYIRWLVLNRFARKSHFDIAKAEFPKELKPNSKRDESLPQIGRVKQGIKRASEALELK